MTRTLRLFVAVLLVAMALFGVFAATALASIDTTPVPTLATSGSNPGSGADAWWRGGWGNTLYPDIELNPPGSWNEQTDGYLLGSIYTIDRVGNTIINTSTPSLYYRDTFPTGLAQIGGTSTNKTLDMLGIYMNPPAGGWPAAEPGTHNALEGTWYYHYMFYSNQQYQDGSFDLAGNYTAYPWTVGFGIDLTPPRAPTGLRLRTGLTTSDVTTWTPATRAYISWDASETDDLSGTGYYQVLVDGSPFMPETSSSPEVGRVYSAPWLPTPDAITVENMPPGAHTVSIQAVDRATNASPPSISKTFYSDPDTPTASWGLPSGNVIDPRTHILSVVASDLAGDPVVTISLGTTLSPSLLTTTIATPQTHDDAHNGVYSFAPDFSAIATGTYTIKATATDHLSRTVTVSKTVTWNPYGLAGTTTDTSVDVTGTIAVAPESAETSTGGTTLWTNQLFPTAALSQPTGASDIFYNIVRSPAALDTNNLQNYYHSLRGDGTQLSQVVNIKDTAENPPIGGWPSGPSGSVAPYEGPWYFQWVWYNNNSLGVSSHTYYVKFNVDRTPPLAVSGFTATPTAGVWTSAQRATISWTPKEYDALSGDMNYLIYLDGNLAMSESATNALAGKATIENMPTGKHTLSIAAEDFAGNIGPKSDLSFQSDPDTPTIAWTSPTNAALSPSNHTFSVDASDSAGDPTVVFKLDAGASYATTLTAGPYTVTPDLSLLAPGSHLLTATVKDAYGRTVTISRAVTWDSYDGSLDATGVAGTSSSYYSGTWINTLFPVATLNNLGGGINYNIVQTPSALDVTNPLTYYHSVDGAGPLFDHTVDLKDTIDAGGPWAAGPSGSVSPYEGTWYFQWKWHSAAGYSATTYRLQFNVDLTPPIAVSNFAITPAAGTWTSQQRAKLTWTNSQSYDSLSGVNRYNVYIDDVLREAVGSTEPVPNELTIEDMPAGKHKVSLSVVDNAGNEGPKTDLYFQSDPDTPTIAWTAPTDNALNVSNHTLSVDASDSAGDPAVAFKIDGGSAYAATVTAPPYSVSPDLSGLSAGAHTLTATVKDALGRTVTITKNVTWGAYDGSLDTTGVPGTSPDYSNSTLWVNTLFPTANLNAPSTATGILYNIVQTPSAVSTVSASNFYHAVQPNGTHFNEIVDLKDTIDAGVGTWLSGPAGSVAPYEGTWYLQWKWYGGTPPTSFVSSDTYRIAFKVDLTPPTAVTGFTSTPAAGVWTSAQRLTLRWDDKEYDALSKTKYYKILIDGGTKEIDVQRTDPVPNAVTIENMTAGKHTVSISAVDWAGNVGPAQSLAFLMDTGTPTVKFTAPTSTLTPSAQTVSVDAEDSAGDPTVVIQISGGSLGASWVTLATLTKAPYTVTPNFVAMGLTDGTYTLRATATNFINQSATVSENVTWSSATALVTDPAVDLTPGTSIGTSKSNPSLTSDAEAWWREGWGNTLTPDFELSPPSSDASHGLVVGMLYNVTTSQTDIDTTQPDLYYRSARPTGTNLNQTIDLQGVFNYPPAGGWRPTPIPGATSGIEGPWYLNLTWFTSMGYSSTRTYHIPMGLDVTPPSLVQSMVVSPTTNSADATSVIATSRIHISWAPKNYDALSGVAYYQVYVDGVASVPDAATNPPQGRVYNIPGASPNSVTIENLTPGKHTIGLAAVDRATNVGKAVETVIYSDPDTPTVKITSPTGSLIGVRPSVTATAADQGGVQSVVFALDGTPIATDYSAPYASQVDLSAFAAGPHVLTATVTDRFGRQVTDSKSVTLDKTPLVLNSVKTAGTGRKVSVTYTVSRPSTIRFALSIAGYSASAVAPSSGTYTFTYTYPKGRKYPSATSFKDTFTLTASDSLGNTASATGKVTVTLAKIVRLSGNRIKIIYY